MYSKSGVEVSQPAIITTSAAAAVQRVRERELFVGKTMVVPLWYSDENRSAVRRYFSECSSRDPP